MVTRRLVRSWSARAYDALLDLASTGEEFTSDDLLEVVGFPDEDHEPNSHNNKIGSVFSRASKAKVIEPVSISQSGVPTRKGGMVRVWRGRSA